MVSVVIPAYDEAQTIERCLSAMLAGASAGELEIIVVCNGCTDRTAELARRFEPQGVLVVETPIGSKPHALNLGDQHATRFPRFYVDADIQLSVDAIRDVAALMARHNDILLAAPKAVVDLEGRSRWVKSYYRVWTQLPYFTQSMVGSGVYAFSAGGRARFDRFPDIISDDEFARRVVKPSERASSNGSTFVISPPHTIAALIDVNTRVRAGMYELRQRFPELSENSGTSPLASLRAIASQPRLWLDAPVYLGVMLLAKLAAERKLARGGQRVWNRDSTARAAAGGSLASTSVAGTSTAVTGNAAAKA